MANRWVGITIDCAHPTRLASFWSAILSIPATAEHGDDPGWATVGSRFDGKPRLTFQRVAEPKIGKVRIHLDVEIDEIEAGRRQVENLGGRWSGERHDYDEGVGMVMHDPEGARILSGPILPLRRRLATARFDETHRAPRTEHP